MKSKQIIILPKSAHENRRYFHLKVKNCLKSTEIYTAVGFLGRVFQKDRNKKTNDGVFIGTQGLSKMAY